MLWMQLYKEIPTYHFLILISNVLSTCFLAKLRKHFLKLTRGEERMWQILASVDVSVVIQTEALNALAEITVNQRFKPKVMPSQKRRGHLLC